MATFIETKATLDAIAQEANAYRIRNNQLLDKATQIEAGLIAMQTQYAGFKTQLDADAAANASDPVWQNAKAEADKLVAEFIAERNRATAIKNAIAAL